MPKKGENMKAVAAKQRKEEKTSAEKAKKEKEIEDALWKDDDKQLAKKQARKDDAEKKRLEAIERKKERDAMLAEEAAIEKGKSAQAKKVAPPPKITRAQIQDIQEQQKLEQGQTKKVAGDDDLDEPIPENLNRIQLEGETATTIDEALNVLKINDNTPEIDKHPEKRMKAAFEDFEKVRLPELKTENPTLRLSQLKQLLRKEWQKHPTNPINRQLAELAKASQAS